MIAPTRIDSREKDPVGPRHPWTARSSSDDGRSGMTGRRPPKPLQATSDLLINVRMGPPPQTSAYEKGSNTSCTIRPVLSFVASHCVRCDRRRGVMSGEVSRIRRDMRGTATLGIPARWSDATRLLERRALLFAEFSPVCRPTSTNLVADRSDGLDRLSRGSSSGQLSRFTPGTTGHWSPHPL